MSKKRDYTRYSKELVETKEPVVETVSPTETIEEEIHTAEPEQIEESKIEESKIERPQYPTGVVTDCLKLNVRSDPHPTATILGVVTAATELIVIKAESTKDFYKICTPAGLEGYCMKKFVTIMP